ncbi:MAG: Ig-like domain-containing protein [Candidatus Woesearchaeota archaeon]
MRSFIRKINFRRKLMLNLISLVIFLSLLSYTKAEIGTNPNSDTLIQTMRIITPTTLMASSTGGLQPIVTETGKISWSIDALGTNYPPATIQVNKPVGASVRKAFLVATSTGFTEYQITNSDITLNGNTIIWDLEIYNSIYSYNYWADVTSIVKPIIDAYPAGINNIIINEANPHYIDGVGLIVIFDDPNQIVDNTIILAFGAQNVAGDTFAIGLADPIDKSLPGFQLDMSIGISYGYQTTSWSTGQYSQIDINGNKLTTSAGGQDDGAGENGALITLGGIDDSNANPGDPYVRDSSPTYDDELYDLIPFVNNGDTSINVYTLNPSTDDNIFFAGFFLGSTTAIAGQGILLSPTIATNLLGEEHTLTASLRDVTGAPIVGVVVSFEIVSGPNSGLTGTAITDSEGKAYFSYVGNTPGIDEIRASFYDSQQSLIESNHVTKEWTEYKIPEFTTISILLAILGVFIFFVLRKR